MTDTRPVLLLDLDNTLLDFDWAEEGALSRTLRKYGVEPTEAMLRRYNEINVRHWEMLEEGVLTRPQVLVGRFVEFFAEQGIDCDGAAVAADYERELGVGHRFISGAEKLLDELYGRYDMYIVSNGCASVQAGRLESSDISRYFKEIFISENIGYDKPVREFFDHCFARIPGFSKERCLIVGDSLTSDIRGGINSGIKSCWFNPRGKEPRPDIVPDYIISSLEELPALAERVLCP